MTKKIIAILAVATILFVCTFASCKKDEGLYSSDKDFELVTDENGKKILSEDGELLVYATDENGKFVKDESGERVTLKQPFEPMENDGIVEDYGFKVFLPDGWKTDNTKVNSFINKSKKETCEISVVKYFYDDYYNKNKDFYNDLKENDIDVNWEDDVNLGKAFKKACRFTMKTDDGFSVLYIFENSGNVYKVLFTGSDIGFDDFLVDTVDFCKAMDFKGFTYYNDITAVSEENK